MSPFDVPVGLLLIAVSVGVLIGCWLKDAADSWDANLARNIEAVERDANPQFWDGLYLERTEPGDGYYDAMQAPR